MLQKGRTVLIIMSVFLIVTIHNMMAMGSKSSLANNKAFNLDGKYLSYDAQKEPDMQEPHVLFFYADWCSWCRRMKKELTEQLDTLPANTVIYEINFDNSGKLKQQYGVKTKDSYVFIDRSQNIEKLKMGARISDFQEFFASGTVNMTKTENPTGFGMYRDYDKDVEKNFIGKKPYALFFYADWCPSCRKLDKQFKSSLADMPSGTSVFKVDFDNSTQLKKKYGVKNKETIVFLDMNGKAVDVLENFNIDQVVDYFTK